MKSFSRFFLIVFTLFFLVSCTPSYTLEVNLTPEERQAALTEIDEMEAYIDQYDYEADPGAIPSLEIIRMAEAYAKLGQIGKAIGIYKDWLGQGYKTRALINNLGRLYEQVGETDLAVAQYQRLIDEYYEDSYLYDITWAYIRAERRKEAEKYFNLWQLKFQKTDLQTQEAVKKLREEEKK